MNRHLRFMVGVILVVTGTAGPAAAHRLDEYLQATRLGVEREHLYIEINLTPGANIASQIVSLIDTDRNGVISDAEGNAYVRRVLYDVTLSIDGSRVPLDVDDHEFPAPDAMAAGVGTIRVRASASMVTSIGRHHLAYSNSHLPQLSVYLVNALVPSDPRVAIRAPKRDGVQRLLDVEFDVQGDPAWTRAVWIAMAVALLAALGTARRSHGARRDPSTALAYSGSSRTSR